MTGKKNSLLFIKMHGLGNDFVVIDGFFCTRSELLRQKKILAKKKSVSLLCDRRFGVGADQILWVLPPEDRRVALARMEVLNADGSRAEMCGNGIRAVALYLDRTLPKSRRKRSYPIETGAGLLHVEVRGSRARVNMGAPDFARDEEKLQFQSEGSAREVLFWEVSVGNPHAVIFVENPKAYPVEAEGRVIELLPRFPKRTNVEFCEALSGHVLLTRVWERGSGMTLACGTGACAAAVAAIVSGRCESPVEVQLPGGSLKIEWDGKALSPVFMTGPAEEVYRGEWKF